MGIPRNQLSDLTSAGLDSDILLRPEDVDEILSRSPNWPVMHIEKKNIYYENNSRT